MALILEDKASMKGDLCASSGGPSSALGWPFGLPTCMVIQTPGPEQIAQPPLAFQEQFMNLQTTFLVPFFSDADGSSSSEDTDSRSETASSFFKDSRRITLGSLIGLPMDSSFRMHQDAHYHFFTNRRRNLLPSCGILELLGCVRNSSSLDDFERSEDGEDRGTVPNSTSLAACLQLERSISQRTNPSDQACLSAKYEDALSTGSRSPDWTDQFVSCHSILSDGEWTGANAGGHGTQRMATSMSLSSKATLIHKSPGSHKLQRSSSMKSFFSSICCRN